MNKMSSNPSVYFIKVLCDKGKQYRIHTVWNDSTFIFTLIDDFKAFKSNISEKVLKRLVKKYEAVSDEYIKEIRNSLCNNINNVLYKRDGNTFTISRKQDSISVQFADFTLEEIDFNNAVINIIDEINASNQFYQNESLEAKKETETVTEEKNQYVQKLEEFVNKKEDMEHELYSKFILILNEKKMRIQYLQESLQKLKTGKGQLNDEEEKEYKVNGTRREILSDSDTETSVDEPAETVVHNVQIECNEETPKKKSNFIDDEDDNIPFKSLPKRVKITANPGPSDIINRIDDAVAADDNKDSSKEITKSPEISIETSKEDSQNSLNFNTQDLFDRL